MFLILGVVFGFSVVIVRIIVKTLVFVFQRDPIVFVEIVLVEDYLLGRVVLVVGLEIGLEVFVFGMTKGSKKFKERTQIETNSQESSVLFHLYFTGWTNRWGRSHSKFST